MNKMDNFKQEPKILFETALLAKQKGFDWPIPQLNGVYDCTTGKIDTNVKSDAIKNWNYCKYVHICSAPTHGLLQAWFRITHDIFISIRTQSEHRVYSDDPGDEEHIPVHLFVIIKNRDNFKYDKIISEQTNENFDDEMEKAFKKAFKMV